MSPPYHPHFKYGSQVRAPARTHSGRYWWVNIIAQSDCGRFVKVQARNPNMRTWWAKADEIRAK